MSSSRKSSPPMKAPWYGYVLFENRDYVGFCSHPTLYTFPLESSTRKIVSSIIFTISYIISPLQILRPTATPTCTTLCRENTIFSESSLYIHQFSRNQKTLTIGSCSRLFVYTNSTPSGAKALFPFFCGGYLSMESYLQVCKLT